MESPNKTRKPEPMRFVEEMCRRVAAEPKCHATLLRAGTAQRGYAAWEYIIPFCDINNERERAAFLLVGAAISFAGPKHDGTQSIGDAIRICSLNTGGDSEKRRLLRLLACDTSLELVDVLRKTVRYLQSKDSIHLNYAGLLKDILDWERGDRVKLRWTQDYFGRDAGGEEGNTLHE